MAETAGDTTLAKRKECEMTTVIFTAIGFLFVAGVLALVAYALYECTPIPHRTNPYRNHDTGRRVDSPHVDEFRDYS
jgi:hypothetical protein